MKNFRDLSLVQKAMVQIYKNKQTLPYLEQEVQKLHKRLDSTKIQSDHVARQTAVLGDETARKQYWINALDNSKTLDL